MCVEHIWQHAGGPGPTASKPPAQATGRPGGRPGGPSRSLGRAVGQSGGRVGGRAVGRAAAQACAGLVMSAASWMPIVAEIVQLPESCRTIARHAARKATPREPSKAVQQLPKHCLKPAPSGEFRPPNDEPSLKNVSQNQAESDPNRSGLAKSGPMLVKTDGRVAKIGHSLPNRPKCERIRPVCTECRGWGPGSARGATAEQSFGNFWTTSAFAGSLGVTCQGAWRATSR